MWTFVVLFKKFINVSLQGGAVCVHVRDCYIIAWYAWKVAIRVSMLGDVRVTW